MVNTSLDQFVARMRCAWGPLTSALAAECHAALVNVLEAPTTEAWLLDLLHELPETRELYRDAEHGFVLLAHTEVEGRYRAPHDHGSSWVAYGVLQGVMEMGTFVRVGGTAEPERLVKQGTTKVLPGGVQIYLPGDIHDTQCLAGPAIQLRFTARDLSRETTMTRYTMSGAGWVEAV